jgi:hypothetical protein
VSSTAKQQLSRNPQNAGYANPIKTYPVPAVTNEDGTISVPAQPVYGIDPNHEPIDMYLAARTIQGIAPSTTTGYATSALGGGLGLTVPAGFMWELFSYSVDLVATATVGNRTPVLRIRAVNGTPLWMGTTSANVTAGQTGGYDVSFGNVGAPSTTVRRNLADTGNTNVQVRDMCPVKWLNAGDVLFYRDPAAIDAADAVTGGITYRQVPV